MKNTLPKGIEILRKFVKRIRNSSSFEIVRESETLCLKYRGRVYVLYFKCVTYAGKPYPEDRTRAQLPCRPDFDSLKNDDIFIFVGYDVDNDVFVCWDPSKTKSRLNKRTYVSFFSRKSFQRSASDGKIIKTKLSNNDSIVAFKSHDVSLFFENFDSIFPDLTQEKLEENIFVDTKKEASQCTLSNVNDDMRVKALVDDCISSGQARLIIIEICMNKFASVYSDMDYCSWSILIKKYLSNNK